MRSSTHLLISCSVLCAMSACRSSFDTQAIDTEETQWSIEQGEATLSTEQDPVEDPIVEPTEPAPMVEPAPIKTPEAALSTCEIEQLWWNEEPIHQLHSRMFGLTPDLGTIVQSHTDYNSWNARRVRDGELMYATHDLGQLLDMDRAWSRELVLDHQNDRQLAVISRDTGETLWSRENASFELASVLSRDGSHVATFECTDYFHEAQRYLTMGLHDVDRGVTEFEMQIDVDQCNYWFGYGNHLTISDDGATMAVAYREFEFDEEGQHHTGDLIIHVISRDGMDRYELTRLDEAYRYEGYIAELAFDPSGEMLHVIDLRGKHSVIDVTRQEVIEHGERGAFVTNWATYLPSLYQSPMVWNEGGDMLASVNLEGHVELSDSRTGEVFFELEAPELGEHNHFIPNDQPNAPTNIAFSPAGDAVFVAFNKGIGAWGCAGALPVARPSLSEVTIQGPSMTRTALPTTFEVSYLQERPTSVVGIKVYVDGELNQSFAHDDEIALRFYREQRHEIIIEVDDGFDVKQSEPFYVSVMAAN